MLIQSDFTDYYDFVQRVAADRNMVYHRYTTNIALRTDYLYDVSIIGVCWKRFLVMEHQKRYIYDIEEMKDVIKSDKRSRKFGSTAEKLKKLNMAIQSYQKFHDFAQAPVWVATNTGVWYNSRLWRYEFHRIMPAQHIYQEIQMWMSNQAEPRKQIPVPSDRDMVEIKGFDPKYSFRKAPTKRIKK